MSRAAGGGGSGPAVLNNGFQQPDFNGVVRREGQAAPTLFASLLAASSEQRAAGTGEGRRASGSGGGGDRIHCLVSLPSK